MRTSLSRLCLGRVLYGPPWLTALLATVVLSPFGVAGGLQVEFDVATTVPCHEVTTPEFAAAFANEKLMQATFNISSLIRRGREADLAEFLYRIESPSGGVRIVDHLPRQELASQIMGAIAVEKKDESSRKVGGLLTGHYPPFSNAELNAQAGASSGLNVRYEMLPPKEVLAASGTLNRERGVYFKLRPSPQTSLEGAKQFVCVLRVPKGWRGDCVRIECQAVAEPRGWPVANEAAECGSATFLVALFAAGDEEARAIMSQVVAADEQLTSAVRRHRSAVPRWLDRSGMPGYGELRQWVSPPSVAALKRRLLERHEVGKLPAEMPSDLREALEAVPAVQAQAKALSWE